MRYYIVQLQSEALVWVEEYRDERLDREWLEGGIASFEARTYTTDASLRAELLSLDPRNAANKKKDFTEDSECSVRSV